MAEVKADNLTTQEKLLLSQAVYKVGAANWPVVSQLLLAHPCLVGRPPTYFTPEACENTYVSLMKGIEINVYVELGGIADPSPTPDGAKPQGAMSVDSLTPAKSHLQLARTFYFARMQELKDQIASYEQRFT